MLDFFLNSRIPNKMTYNRDILILGENVKMAKVGIGK